MVGSLATAQSLSAFNFGSGIGRDPNAPPYQYGNPPTNLNYSSFPYQGSSAGSGISPLIFILPILFSVLPLLLSGLQSLFSSGGNNENSSCKNNQNKNNSNSNGCQQCDQQRPNLDIEFNNNNDYSGGRS